MTNNCLIVGSANMSHFFWRKKCAFQFRVQKGQKSPPFFRVTKLKTTAILIVSRKVFNLFHSELIVTRGKPLSRNLTTSCYSKKIKLVTRFFPNCSNTILQIFCIMQFAILYPPNLFLLGAFSETKSR